MAETYTLISTITFALSGVLLILTVFLWFWYRIPKVIGELSGKTAQKTIRQMQSAEGISSRAYAPSARAFAPGRTTGGLNLKTRGRTETSRLFEIKASDERGKKERRNDRTAPPAQQTMVLDGYQAGLETTGLLNSPPAGSEKTEVLLPESSFTLGKKINLDEIRAKSQATELLKDDNQAAGAPRADAQATELLRSDSQATELLQRGTQPLGASPPATSWVRSHPVNAAFKVVETILMVHTDEEIS